MLCVSVCLRGSRRQISTKVHNKVIFILILTSIFSAFLMNMPIPLPGPTMSGSRQIISQIPRTDAFSPATLHFNRAFTQSIP